MRACTALRSEPGFGGRRAVCRAYNRLTVRRILYGYRNDLKLADRWWHRALFVLAGFMALAVLFVTVGISSDAERNAARTVEVQSAYLDFVKAAAAERTPIILISGYAASGATTYCRTPTDSKKSIYSFTEGADHSFCTKPEYVFAAVAETIKLFGDKANVAAEGLLESRINKSHGVVCVIASSFPDCEIDSILTEHIVDNPISASGWMTVAWTTTAFFLGFLLLAANLYHRILLYIIFGKRRIAENSSVLDGVKETVAANVTANVAGCAGRLLPETWTLLTGGLPRLRYSLVQSAVTAPSPMTSAPRAIEAYAGR